MNKNIKDEFDSLISNQAPDLWNRIEASLPEKTSVAEQTTVSEQTSVMEQANVAEQVNPAEHINVTEQINTAGGESKPVKHRLYRKYAAYGTVGIAACLCITLVALNNSSPKSYNNMTADETATEEIVFEDAETAEDTDAGGFMMESDTDGAYNGVVEDFLDTADYEEEAVKDQDAEGTVAESQENRAEEAKYESGSVAGAEDMDKESLSSQKTEENSQALQDKKAELSAQGYLVYQDALIRIESVSETVEEGKNVVIYHVTILEAIENMEKEMRLDLKADELFNTRLTEGESCRVTFYDNKMPYDSSIHEYFLLEAE